MSQASRKPYCRHLRIDSPKIGSPHGMRNELSLPNEMALERASLHSCMLRVMQISPMENRANYVIEIRADQQ
jgi:hypothetical protein